MCTYTYSYIYGYRRIHVCIEKYLSISMLSCTDIVVSIYNLSKATDNNRQSTMFLMIISYYYSTTYVYSLVGDESWMIH